MYKRIIFIIISLSICVSASAQQYMSIDQYLQKVIDYSQHLKISKQNTQSAMSSQSAIKTGFLPKLDAGADFSYQFKKIGLDFGGSSIFMRAESYQAQAALVQNVYSGSAVRNQYEMAKINTEISQTTEEMTLDNIEFAAESNYWNLAANEEMLQISGQYIDIVKRLFTIVNERFDGGQISRTDVMMTETRLKEAEYQYANAQKAYKVASQNFNILMGVGVNSDFVVSDTILKVVVMPNFLTLDSVLLERPDYRIAQKQIDYQMRNIKLSQAKFNPQFAIGVQGQWGTQMLNFDGKTILNGVTYAKLSVPIFHWGERRKTVSAGKAQLRVSEFQKQLVEDQVSQELSNTMTSIEENYNQVNIAQVSLSIARENLYLNTFSYNEGKLTILDVLSAQGSWLQSYMNAISANYNYKLSVAQYKKVTSGASSSDYNIK